MTKEQNQFDVPDEWDLVPKGADELSTQEAEMASGCTEVVSEFIDPSIIEQNNVDQEVAAAEKAADLKQVEIASAELRHAMEVSGTEESPIVTENTPETKEMVPSEKSAEEMALQDARQYVIDKVGVDPKSGIFSYELERKIAESEKKSGNFLKGGAIVSSGGILGGMLGMGVTGISGASAATMLGLGTLGLATTGVFGLATALGYGGYKLYKARQFAKAKKVHSMFQ